MLTLLQWPSTVVCKQFIAARETSLLPLKMLSFIKRSRDSHPAEISDITWKSLWKKKRELKRIPNCRHINGIQLWPYLTRNCLRFWGKERKNVTNVLFHQGLVQVSHPIVSELCSDYIHFEGLECSYSKRKDCLRLRWKNVN